METLRLRRIHQQPSQLTDWLFRAEHTQSVNTEGLLPNSGLPRTVVAAASRSGARKKNGHVWACWADSDCAWLFTWEMSLALSRQRGAPVPHVHLSDQTGEPKEGRGPGGDLAPLCRLSLGGQHAVRTGGRFSPCLQQIADDEFINQSLTDAVGFRTDAQRQPRR